MSRSLWIFSLSIAVLVALPCPAPACPWDGEVPTLLTYFKEAKLVLFGKCLHTPLPSEILDGGITDFAIEKVLKRHMVLGDKKVLTLPGWFHKTELKGLIFCDVYKGGYIEPFHWVEVQRGDDIVKYLEGALKVRQRSIGACLRYCFDYLDNPEKEIALDAFRQFAAADYKHIRKMARHLPPDKIAAWLTDSKTPPTNMGLYALLLGHCGKDTQAKILRRLLATPQKWAGGGIRCMDSGGGGMLVGYTLLKPGEGWAHIRDTIVNNPKEDFQLRFKGLRSLCFLWDNWPGVVARKDLMHAMRLLLDQTDIADLAIEELRTRKCWDVADQVLALAKQESHNLPVIQRAVLRFAMSCPLMVTKAAAFLKAERMKDKKYVADVEELLKIETEALSE